MREDYRAAKKLGEDAVKEAKRVGASPYLPVLDEMPEIKDCTAEVRLGLLELPLRRIVGNKEMGRNSAFANNFMPLLEEGTEFAVKWSNLYDSFLKAIPHNHCAQDAQSDFSSDCLNSTQEG